MSTSIRYHLVLLAGLTLCGAELQAQGVDGATGGGPTLSGDTTSSSAPSSVPITPSDRTAAVTLSKLSRSVATFELAHHHPVPTTLSTAAPGEGDPETEETSEEVPEEKIPEENEGLDEFDWDAFWEILKGIFGALDVADTLREGLLGCVTHEAQDAILYILGEILRHALALDTGALTVDVLSLFNELGLPEETIPFAGDVADGIQSWVDDHRSEAQQMLDLVDAAR